MDMHKSITSLSRI